MNKIYKKSISLLLAAALLFMALPVGAGFIAAANFIPEGFTPIHTADELEGIGNNAGGCYILMNDIDLSGSSLYPLALDFSGTLDGNGFTVSNFSLLAQEGYIGLLGRNRGTVKNLNITNCSITSYTSYIGCIAALNCGSIFNCNVEASIDYSLSTSCLDIEVYCGFITGDNANAGTVSHCSSQGNLSISA